MVFMLKTQKRCCIANVTCMRLSKLVAFSLLQTCIVPHFPENYVDSKIAVIYVLQLLFPYISSQFHHPSLRGIRDIAAVTCHWCKVPISSYLVSFF